MSKGDRTRDRVLDSALALASTEGVTGMSLGRLAEQVGMSKSGLFAHFGSKEALQVEILERAADRFREAVVRPALAEPRGEPRVRAIFERWLAWVDQQGLPGGCVLTAAWPELDDQPGPPRDALARSHAEMQEFLARAAELAVEAGHFREDLDPRLFAFQLQSLVFGVHFRSRLLRDPAALDLARQAFEVLLATSRRPA